MKTKASFRNGLLIACVCLPLFVFGQYGGGSEDGSSAALFCANDLGGMPAVALTLNAVTGQSNFCSFSSDIYSVTVLTGTASSFVWSLPVGANVLRKVDTPTSSIVSVSFGNSSGNISVTASNSCSTVSSASFLVTATNCNQFFGASNDGFSFDSFCATNLNGGASAAITLSSVIGSTSFCAFSSDVFSITVTSGIANSFSWNLPVGASIIYSFTTLTSSMVSINFGNTSGNISVTATNSCSTVTSSALSVTSVACNQYVGGNDDGFGNATFCASNLSGGSLGIISLSAISGNNNFCFNGSQNYSVNVTTGIATSFSWTTPSGGSLLAVQNATLTSLASLGFGVTDGNLQVTATNGCSTAFALLAVTGQNCNITFGGSDDGFGSAIYCGLDLAGTALGPITLSAIASPGTYCINLGQNYSVTTSSGLATIFVWTALVGGGINSGSQSSTISSLATISFPGAGGTVQVNASNGCFSDSRTLAVTGVNCDVAFGGSDDGFTSASFCGSNLTGGSPGVVSLNTISGADFCLNLGQPYSITAISGNPSSFIWSVPTGSGTTISLLSGFGASSASIIFSSASATVQVNATNGCTSDSKTIIVNGSNCNQALGGNDDGFTSVVFCGSNLSGGVLAPIALSAISGDANFCVNNGQNYSVIVTNGIANLYSWSGPPAAGSYAQQSTSTTSLASFNFVNTSGNVSVSATNGCSTAIASLPVTGVNCNTTLGAANDGYSSLSFCGSNLSGGAVTALILNPISGSGTFCFDLGGNYSVTTSAGNATSFLWSGPTGSAQAGTLNTFTSSLVTINFAATSGMVSVTATNACFSDTRNLAVSGVSCLLANGGSNDGFAFGQLVNAPLPVTLISFNGKQIQSGIELSWITESEINNDFFVVERSRDGKTFSSLSKIAGAGTTRERKNYSYQDKQPYRGIAYYRLKQTDFDGKFEYSTTIAMEYVGPTDTFDAELYPNPTASNSFTIRFNPAWEGNNTMVEVSDITGKIIFRRTLICSNATHIKPPEDSPLQSGVYIIFIYVDNRKLINRLVVQ